jgi:hypothetical protein
MRLRAARLESSPCPPVLVLVERAELERAGRRHRQAARAVTQATADVRRMRVMLALRADAALRRDAEATQDVPVQVTSGTLAARVAKRAPIQRAAKRA